MNNKDKKNFNIIQPIARKPICVQNYVIYLWKNIWIEFI